MIQLDRVAVRATVVGEIHVHCFMAFLLLRPITMPIGKEPAFSTLKLQLPSFTTHPSIITANEHRVVDVDHNAKSKVLILHLANRKVSYTTISIISTPQAGRR